MLNLSHYSRKPHSPEYMGGKLHSTDEFDPAPQSRISTIPPVPTPRHFVLDDDMMRVHPPCANCGYASTVHACAATVAHGCSWAVAESAAEKPRHCAEEGSSLLRKRMTEEPEGCVGSSRERDQAVVVVTAVRTVGQAPRIRLVAL